MTLVFCHKYSFWRLNALSANSSTTKYRQIVVMNICNTVRRNLRFIPFLKSVYYRPQRSCGKGNIFAPVCHSVHKGGGGGIPEGTETDPPPPGADTTPPGTRPPPQEADSSIRSTSGRYASYWNAFLFQNAIARICYKYRS